MKSKVLLTLAASLALVSSTATAAVYGDATGEVIVPGSPFPHLDISSVDVNNDATTLTFKINLVGDPVATDWGKYMIGIDSVPGGDPAGNGWTRPISMSSGMDYFVGGWVDFGNGAEVRNWTGSWNLQSATWGANPDAVGTTKNTSSVTISFNYAGLGLGVGSTFLFDVYSSGGGGGDSAVDAAANPASSIVNWGDFYNSGNNVFSYTIVPEPAMGSLLLIGLGLIAGRRMARK